MHLLYLCVSYPYCYQSHLRETQMIQNATHCHKTKHYAGRKNIRIKANVKPKVDLSLLEEKAH
jgi:hypothetical protein